MITLTEKWQDPQGGLIFPIGTVFIEQRVLAKGRGTVYTYATPGGTRGEALFAEGMYPGGAAPWWKRS